MFKKLALAALIIAGIWYVLYGSKIYERNQQLSRTYVASLVPIKAHDVVLTVKNYNNSGIPVLIYVYKSKCLMCKLYFSDIIKISSNYSGRVKVIAVSVDENPLDLAAFLRTKKLSFEPFILDGAKPEGLAAELKTYLLLHFDGGVPFAAVVSTNYAPQEFSSGPGFYDRIDNYLKGKKEN